MNFRSPEFFIFSTGAVKDRSARLHVFVKKGYENKMTNFLFRPAPLGIQVTIAVALSAAPFSNAHSQAIGPSDVESQNRGLSGPGVRSRVIPEVLQINNDTADTAASAADEAAIFPVTRFRIEGLTALSADDVLARAAKKIPLDAGTYSLKRVREIAAEVQRVLRAEGLIGAIALVPAQKLTDGTLSIRVVEARLASSHFSEVTDDPDNTIFPPRRVAMLFICIQN